MSRYLDRVFTVEISFRRLRPGFIGEGEEEEELDRGQVTRWRSISFKGIRPSFVEGLDLARRGKGGEIRAVS